MRNIHTIKVMWPDCDPAGIIFHGNYFRWMDDASHLLFDKAGYSFDRLVNELGMPGFPLVSMHADFRSPGRLGDNLDIETYVSEMGNASFMVSHIIRRDDEVVVESWQKRIWCRTDRDNGGKFVTLPIADEFRRALAPL